MYAFAKLGDLVAGTVAGGVTIFPQLFVFIGLYIGVQSVFTNLPVNPAAGQALLLNLIVYTIPVLVILFGSAFSNAEPTRASSFLSAFIITFPLIWLACAWQPHG